MKKAEWIKAFIQVIQRNRYNLTKEQFMNLKKRDAVKYVSEYMSIRAIFILSASDQEASSDHFQE